jgi:hypothetical protein
MDGSLKITGSGRKVLDYLGRYVFRIAITTAKSCGK